MFQGGKIFNASFDVFAGNYHSVRPGYPPKVYEDIARECGITPDSRLLEIGAGSGIATQELAKLGCDVVALEPGGHLASIAKENSKQYPKVSIVVDTFERYESPEPFDAILAFTAFHWITDGESGRFRKLDSLLKPAGSLALVWNSFFQSNTPVTEEVNAAYRELLPEVYPDDAAIETVNQAVLEKLHGREREVLGNSTFYTTFLRKYPVSYRYDAESYPKLLNTYPKVIGVEGGRRKTFLDRIGSIVQRHGIIAVPVLTTVILSQRREYYLQQLSNQ
jgi:protein-L-isoaspartate O-methyltransferase